jgi:predicted patatin/cPLA2 family phospholipase
LGNDRFFFFFTKHESYVQKPNGGFLNFIIDLLYWRYPRMRKSIRGRVAIFYKEIDQVEELQKAGKAIFMRPSKLFNVSRLSATKEDLIGLFNLGYQDCEDRKAEIKAFFGK